MTKYLAALLVGAAALASCNNPDNEFGPLVPSAPGVYILNEGQFGQGGGIVSAYGVASKTTLIDAFGSVNKSSSLGDVVQDMGVVNNRGYVCVNNSRKVEVVSLPDFKSVATIRRIEQPRYFAASTTRGYVTSWRGNYTAYQPGKVMVIDLSTNQLVDSITVGRCPERAALLGNSLYVPNSYDNTVSVIDLTTNKVSSTVTVADGPTGTAIDQASNVWVLCSGFTVYNSQPPYNVISSTPGTLARFAPGSPANVTKLAFATAGPRGLRISPDRTQLYYSYSGAEYSLGTSATALPTTPFMRRNFSGFAIDPRDNSIFGAVSPSYNSNGYFLHYPAGGGARLDSVTVRVGPNGFAFY